MNISKSQLEEIVFLACKLEATARKLGNVHPDAAFEDSSYTDFIMSAEVIAPILSTTTQDSIGASILAAVKATQATVNQNTNLGIILLIAPLASIQYSGSVVSRIEKVLDGMTVEDSKLIYTAINCANPSGMGSSESQDLSEEPTEPFRAIMSSVADRDSIARAYSNAFEDILPKGNLEFQKDIEQLLENWEQAIIQWQLELMSELPDTLILRKCGPDVAQESAAMAGRILEADWPETESSQKLIIEFDEWLRADGNKRNPGTTADLIAAKIFLLLRETYNQPNTQQFISEMLKNGE